MKKFFASAILILIVLTNSWSQEMVDTSKPGKNLVKFNFSGLFVGNYIAQYERVVGKRSSLAFTLSVAPNTGLPFKDALMEEFSDNEDAKAAIESTLYTKYNFTLEYRFYLSKGAPKGFYLAPFLRYMNMELEQDYPFTPSDGKQHVATVSSKFGAFGGGLMVGTQWTIKKHWAIDWWIIGGFYGSQIDADFYGVDPIGGLSTSDQADLENDIESVDIPGYTIDATVSPNTTGPTQVWVNMKGPYYGIRGAGLCLAYRF
jgi:hypothetical protein